MQLNKFWGLRFLPFLMLALVFSSLAACATTSPLDVFSKQQKEKIVSDTAYNQAELDFYAAMYEPTPEDMDRFRRAWISHGRAFPESPAIEDINRELSKSGQRVVLVGMFTDDYEIADLKDKALGWAVSPVPLSITELSHDDGVLRTLMPIRNIWARYFLLIYSAESWILSSQLIVSNRTSKAALKKPEYRP